MFTNVCAQYDDPETSMVWSIHGFGVTGFHWVGLGHKFLSSRSCFGCVGSRLQI